MSVQTVFSADFSCTGKEIGLESACSQYVGFKSLKGNTFCSLRVVNLAVCPLASLWDHRIRLVLLKHSLWSAHSSVSESRRLASLRGKKEFLDNIWTEADNEQVSVPTTTETSHYAISQFILTKVAFLIKLTPQLFFLGECFWVKTFPPSSELRTAIRQSLCLSD